MVVAPVTVCDLLTDAATEQGGRKVERKGLSESVVGENKQQIKREIEREETKSMQLSAPLPLPRFYLEF